MTTAVFAAKDPTRPPDHRVTVPNKVQAVNSFHVESIISGGGRKIAVINGQQVFEGGSVSGARVVKIERDAVTLSWPDLQTQTTLKKRISINQSLTKKWLKRDRN
ncbi:hypothetical protein [Motiliproteus sp. MSK22-1]|uniref:hypothetical protein n=1 Tax=Motiliproteus sp. MSK22-1 TaxID=1897630 RepID=UPI000975A115|nr:hypothetical protein [Motiliproteus sp. MSK22-1]OMH39527.1 hypothetical protein BGP75_02750 [Motiliproteus sp. MSK22-1]